ncbi:hypothetical protein GCM10009753_44820 [Streptantibioticus ferralitis]
MDYNLPPSGLDLAVEDAQAVVDTELRRQIKQGGPGRRESRSGATVSAPSDHGQCGGGCELVDCFRMGVGQRPRNSWNYSTSIQPDHAGWTLAFL